LSQVVEIDFAVVGSGIGAALFSALNANKNLHLFEKENSVGGCAGTFKHKHAYYNTGATTFVGYENNHAVKKLFDKAGVVPNIHKSDVAMLVIQGKKKLYRYQNFEAFLSHINDVYYHQNNRVFWKTMYEIDQKFWQLKNIYFAKYSVKHGFKTARFVAELLTTFKHYLFMSAEQFIAKTLSNISKQYQAFIDAQLQITVQANSKQIPLLSMALGLSYPFHDVFYANNGMKTVIEELLKNVNVHLQQEVLYIKKRAKMYEIVTNKEEYLAKNVILNSTVYDSSKLFLDEEIQNHYEKFTKSQQSAFVVYLKLQSSESFLEHYQIILQGNIKHCISNSFFVSISRKEDEVLSQNGYSITISTHTNSSFWDDLSKEAYEEKKLQTQEAILKEFLAHFDMIDATQISTVFSATSKTFERFINRKNCGGVAMNFKNMFQLSSCNTPFEGLYNVGDTVFAGQGWPGVALGVDVLNKVIQTNEER
jgi:phytoene dehydrogenase-like protein